MQIADCGMRIEESETRPSGSGQAIADCGLRNADWRKLSVVSFQLSVECLAATRRGARSNCRLQTAECGLKNQRRDRQGGLPRVRVVCARTGKAVPHGRASDLRFLRLFGARIVPPCQSLAAAYARLLFVLEGHPKIAQRFIAGFQVQDRDSVPQGRLRGSSTKTFGGCTSVVPTGLSGFAAPRHPSPEGLGYFQQAQRASRLRCILPRTTTNKFVSPTF